MALIKLNNRSSEDNAIHGRRNLIINGAMRFAQRRTTASINNAEGFVLDRFNTQNNSAITTTTEQSSDAPDGFDYSYKLTFTTGAASSTNNYSITNYYFEKQDLLTTGHGTSSAKNVTLSFWVKSSVTGNHVLGLQSWAPSRRSNTHSYTINSANTWEHKTVTFTMDTTALTVNDNAKAFGIRFGHAAGTDYEAPNDTGGWITADDFGFSGATYPGETTNATWQITGIQMEVGDTATPFEHRSYQEELQLCERYFQLLRAGSVGTAENTSRASFGHRCQTGMRAAPTISLDATRGHLNQPQGGPNQKTTMNNVFWGVTQSEHGGFLVIDTSDSWMTTGRLIFTAGTTGMVKFDSEL
jgi:hypothetical protein